MARGEEMNCETAIDRFIADMLMQGRLTSPSSERGYRSTLLANTDRRDLRHRRSSSQALRQLVIASPNGQASQPV